MPLNPAAADGRELLDPHPTIPLPITVLDAAFNDFSKKQRRLMHSWIQGPGHH